MAITTRAILSKSGTPIPPSEQMEYHIAPNSNLSHNYNKDEFYRRLGMEIEEEEYRLLNTYRVNREVQSPLMVIFSSEY